MNPVIKEALKEDIRYTISMFAYIIVLTIVFGMVTMFGSGENGADSHRFFYIYMAIFGVFITSAYGASKAKMDRYFNMGFSRNVFRKQGILLGTIRSAIMAVGFSLFHMLMGVLSGRSDIAGMIVDENSGLPQGMTLIFNMILLFLFGWTVNNHMLADATMEKPKISSSVYLTSPSIWSFNNNKRAKNRSGNRVIYLIMVIIYAGAAIAISTIIQWFFQWWMLAAVVIGLVVLNLVLISIFTRKIKCIDVV